MNLCMCGDAVQDGSTLCPRCNALQVLDLESGATEDEIRKAYRILVKVWHPDRFQNDEKLKEAAEIKLKEINSAFEFLTSTSDRRGPWRPHSRPFNGAASPSSQEAAAKPASEQSSSAAPTPAMMPDLAPRIRSRRIIRFSLKAAALLVALLLCRYLWIAFDLPDLTGGDTARVYDKGKETLLRGVDKPRTRFIEAIRRDIERLHPSESEPAAPAAAQTSPADPASQQPAQMAPQKTGSQRQDRASTAPQKTLPYITVGSTVVEVLDIQGTPAASTGNKLIYGKSELYLKNGAVVGWRIDPVASPIRVKLWPSTAVDPTLASYTVGSTKDVVLAVQGTPTAFTNDRFEYGKSVVIFRNNKVVSWQEDPDSNPLWAR